ncbi:hypothetical protein RH831_09010 [Halodesulfurarchaeum sp. HSR-GB]|uniref:hypothetical protein n=1 Tax=Halodesulfurarchaeum sp. HSR-GB TaxID=3074077 RepID=UPI00285E55FC|nr:hypothetical protein [Halodesulfurarchaeum sp. HSR-GB]MDR5657318.1 hypothetical protein [Halodesulfurarchaeum sp. HSR-GB]
MDLEIDGGVLLYVLGVGFAFAALAYFVRDVVFSLSITVKAALLLLAFLVALLGGLTVNRADLDWLSMVLSGAAYVVFLGYVVTRYALGPTHTFFVLAVSAVLFVALGYGLRQHRPDVPGRTGVVLMIALVGVGILLVGADVGTVNLTSDVEFEESVTVTAPAERTADRATAPGEAVMGTITVTNPGPFTRPLTLPQPSACLAGVDVGDGDVHVDYRPRSYERPDRIAGGESQTYQIVVRAPVPGNSTERTYAIERGADCAGSWSQPTVVVDVPDVGET